MSFGTLPEPSLPISTVIGPFSPGISTVVFGGYVEPSGFFGVTTASPFGCWVISILPGFSVSGVSGVVTVTFTGTSSVEPSG